MSTFDADGNLDIDPMIFLQAVIDEQIEVIDMSATMAGFFGPEIPHVSEGVIEIARTQIARAQATLDILIAEDDTWSSSEWCEMEFEGNDTDGTEWYRCKIHGRMVLGDAYVWEGYEPPPYVEPEK